jgi:hypothetical protein
MLGWAYFEATRQAIVADNRLQENGVTQEAAMANLKLTSPHDILSAYSRGLISSGDAIASLHLSGCRDLLIAMADAGHSLPRPPREELEAQVAGALPLLREALELAEADDA